MTSPEYVWNALETRHGVKEFDPDIDDLVRDRLCSCDGKDTARDVAKWVAEVISGKRDRYGA